MRIYAVADIHGRHERIELISDNIEKFKPEVLVVAGDITNYGRPVETLAQLNEMPVPILAVRGNTDPARIEKLLEQYPKISPLHLKEVNLNGIGFVGVSGTVPIPFSSRLSWREGRVREKVDPLLNRHSVLVAHTPPWGTLDEVFGKFHAGCKSLHTIVSKHQPGLLICGHIHEKPGTALVGKTLVVNCNMGQRRGGAMIEFDKDQTPEVQML